MYCKMSQNALQNGPFQNAKRPIPQCKTAHFANWSGKL